MSVQTTASRPAVKSAGAGAVGVVVTLVGFVTIFLSFVIAPLLVLTAAFLVFAMLRPRQDKSEQSGTTTTPGRVAYGFGAGTQ
ncbi:hypothetical protein [Nocardioides salsibiostraticola]